MTQFRLEQATDEASAKAPAGSETPDGSTEPVPEASEEPPAASGAPTPEPAAQTKTSAPTKTSTQAKTPAPTKTSTPTKAPASKSTLAPTPSAPSVAATADDRHGRPTPIGSRSATTTPAASVTAPELLDAEPATSPAATPFEGGSDDVDSTDASDGLGPGDKVVPLDDAEV